AVAVPATVVGSTTTIASAEFSTKQLPLCTTARKCVVALNTPLGSGLAVETMSLQLLPSAEDCHFTIAPTWPLKVIVVLLPLQIGLAVAVAVPATVVGSTTTIASAEFSTKQLPLCTTARKCVVALNTPLGSGLAVETMSLQLLPSAEDCHFTIAPTWPLKVIVVLLPLQIGLAVAVAVPATVVGSTTTIASAE